MLYVKYNVWDALAYTSSLITLGNKLFSKLLNFTSLNTFFDNIAVFLCFDGNSSEEFDKNMS